MLAMSLVEKYIYLLNVQLHVPERYDLEFRGR
jgi:hypothetical protein